LAKNRWISDLHWVRTGQQTRSQKTQALLLDAAATLFAEQGVDATAVVDVARHAGCSVGALYHHFRDKQTLVYALFDKYTEEARSMTAEATDPARWEGACIVDILGGYLEFVLLNASKMMSVKRAITDASRNDPAMYQHLADLQAELDVALTRLLLARKAEIGHPQPALAIGFVLDQFSAMLHARKDKASTPTRLMKRANKVFIEQCLHSAVQYLNVGAAG
jgi:AcrR family transcriptional regulator